jgi:hypothetical protein
MLLICLGKIRFFLYFTGGDSTPYKGMTLKTFIIQIVNHVLVVSTH